MSKRTLLMAVLCLGLAAPAAYAANASGSKSRPAGINAREHRQTAYIPRYDYPPPPPDSPGIRIFRRPKPGEV